MFDAKDFMEVSRSYDWAVKNRGVSPVPSPDACGVCGEDARNHGMRYMQRANGESGFHLYEAPTNAMRLLRMKARRSLKN